MAETDMRDVTERMALPVADKVHQQHQNADGTMHYDGVLGKFDYDPKEFQLAQVDYTQADGTVTPIEILRYVGTETDGAKIHVPEGLENGFMTFMNTGITSTPKLPTSLKFGDAMFQKCDNLKTANCVFPPKMESASFMFANCANLTQGPTVVPGGCKNASFMFCGCRSLENTPKLGKGMQYSDFMFADCHSLKEPPKMPSTMRNADCATVNCPGIDATVTARQQARLEKDRAKFVKRMDSPTLGQRISSAFSALMQVHALHQMGYGLIAGPLTVHAMRKSGAMARDFAGGMAALAMTRPHGGMTSALAAAAASRSAKKQAKRETQRAARMDAWDRVHSYGMAGQKDYKMMTTAQNDAKKGLFSKVQRMSSNEKLAYQQKCCGTYVYRENLFNQLANSEAGVDLRTKQNMSKWFQQEMSAAATYYQEGLRAIQDDKLFPTAAAKAEAKRGLDEISKLQTEPLMDAAQRMQKQHQLFNEGDIRNISKMMDNMPWQKERGGSFADHAYEGVDPKRSGKSHVEQAMHRFSQFATEGTEKTTDGPEFG